MARRLTASGAAPEHVRNVARAARKAGKQAQRDPVRFDLEVQRTRIWRGILRVAERGMQGQIDARKAPGFAVGLRAASMLVDRTDPVGVPVGGAPVVAVQVVLSAASVPAAVDGHGLDATAGLPPGGVEVRLARNGHGGNGASA